MDRPEGRVVRPDEQPDLVDDHLQDIVDGLQAGDRPGRRLEGVDDIGRCLCVLATAHARHGSSARVRSQYPGRLARQMRAGWPMASRHRHPQPMEMSELRAPRGPRILLAVDLTPASRDASNEAIKRAKDDGADLIVLSVVEQHNLHLPGGGARRVDQERDRLASGAQAIVRQARDAGVRATFLIWEGDPAEAILEASQSEDADVIVLGSRPRLNVRRLILAASRQRWRGEPPVT